TRHRKDRKTGAHPHRKTRKGRAPDTPFLLQDPGRAGSNRGYFGTEVDTWILTGQWHLLTPTDAVSNTSTRSGNLETEGMAQPSTQPPAPVTLTPRTLASLKTVVPEASPGPNHTPERSESRRSVSYSQAALRYAPLRHEPKISVR